MLSTRPENAPPSRTQPANLLQRLGLFAAQVSQAAAAAFARLAGRTADAPTRPLLRSAQTPRLTLVGEAVEEAVEEAVDTAAEVFVSVPARSTPAPEPVSRFLTSIRQRVYCVAISRATGGFGKYRFSIDENGAPWALRELDEGGARLIEILGKLAKRLPVVDEIKQAGHHYAVLPLMAGELTDAVARLKEPTARRALARSMMAQLAEDLVHCHDQGFVHRDVKLGSALWNTDGSIVLSEWGSALPKNAQGEVSGPCGTQGYMAPELLYEDSYDEKVDVWSLAMAFTAIVDNRLQRLFALAPRNPDIILSFAKWRSAVVASPGWVNNLQSSRSRWDEYFAQLANADPDMCQFIVERMLVPPPSLRATAAETLRAVRRLQTRGDAAERHLLRALETLGASDAKREASLTALRITLKNR